MYVLQIWITLILTVIVYVECGDNPSNTHGTIESDSDGEDDNFDVTEPSNDVIPQPSTELSEEEEIDLELSEPEEHAEHQPPGFAHQPFTPEPEQEEPLDLSIKSTQPQPVEPLQPAHPFQPIQPTLPTQPQFPQPIQPGYLVRPIAPYPRPPIQPQQPSYPGPQFQVQQPAPTQPIYPRPPIPVLRPIPRYPQIPYLRHYYPRYLPYHPYQRYRPPRQPIPPPPTHYMPPPPTHYVPPPQEPIQRPSIPHIVLPTTQPTPPAHYVPQPQPPIEQPIEEPEPIEEPAEEPIEESKPVDTIEPSETQKRDFEKKTEGRCKLIKLMKRNLEGELIPMTKKDLKQVSYDSNKRKFEIYANLEQLICDGELAYEHTPGKPYASTLIENKQFKEFFIRIKDILTIVRHVNNKWKVSDHQIPFCFELFTKDSEGNDVLITKENIDVEFTSFEFYKYTFIRGIKCHKVVVKDKLVWEKKEDDEGYPLVIIINKLGRVTLSFEEQTVIFIEKYDCYEELCTKQKKRSKKK